jgi:hypothetical protein
MVKHDPKLNLFNPDLMIVSHKSTPYLHDQHSINKKRGHLRDYLEATQDFEGPYPGPTNANLELA